MYILFVMSIVRYHIFIDVKRNTSILFTFKSYILIFLKIGWDIKVDWVFLDKNARENRFLREKIVYPSKKLYYFAFVQNFVLRFIWNVRIFHFNVISEIQRELIFTMLGLLEIYR